MRSRPEIPEDIEEYRDEHWCREGTRLIETAFDAECFIERIGFAACLTDSRRPGPSLYVSVCGRRDAVLVTVVGEDVQVSPAGRVHVGGIEVGLPLEPQHVLGAEDLHVRVDLADRGNDGLDHLGVGVELGGVDVVDARVVGLHEHRLVLRRQQ